MSHIAFDLDALPLVPKVARSAGIGEAVVGWGLTQMWEWCWREKTDRVTTNHLRGFFGAELGAILVDFGFLDATGSGVWRVKGAARYLRIQEGRERGGKDAKANLKQYQPKTPQPDTSHRLASGSPPADDRLPLRLDTGLSATSDERLATSDKPFSAPRKRDAGKPPEKLPDPRHVPLREKLKEAFRRKRGADMPWDGRTGKTLTALLEMRAREDMLWPVELLAAFERALLATHPDLKSLEEFKRDLVRYVGTGPPKPAAKGASWTQDAPDTGTSFLEGLGT